MNKEQIIDETYENYENKYYKGEAFGYKKLNNLEYSPDLKLSQEEFINKCKTDSEFSEKWGIQIEERELSLDERHYILTKTKLLIPISDDVKDNWIEILNEKNIPTRLITITYNNETIESYE